MLRRMFSRRASKNVHVNHICQNPLHLYATYAKEAAVTTYNIHRKCYVVGSLLPTHTGTHNPIVITKGNRIIVDKHTLLHDRYHMLLFDTRSTTWSNAAMMSLRAR